MVGGVFVICSTLPNIVGWSAARGSLRVSLVIRQEFGWTAVANSSNIKHDTNTFHYRRIHNYEL